MPDHEIPKSNMFIVRLVVFLSRAVFKVYFRLECEGGERVRQVLRLDGPVITIMNHASSLDPLAAAA